MGLEVSVDSTALDVRITGGDRFWGLRSRLEVPTARIVAASVRPTSAARADLWLRSAGLGFPGVAAVGYFRGAPRRASGGGCTAPSVWW